MLRKTHFSAFHSYGYLRYPKKSSALNRQLAGAWYQIQTPCLLASGPAATDAWYRPRHLFATPEEPVRARCRIVAICCQAVDSGASNASTVWRQVATAVWRQLATCDLSSPKASFRLTRSQRRGTSISPPGCCVWGRKGGEPIDHWQRFGPLAVSFASFASLR